MLNKYDYNNYVHDGTKRIWLTRLHGHEAVKRDRNFYYKSPTDLSTLIIRLL